MRITESELRCLIRQELIKEGYRNHDVLQEAFLKDLKQKLGRKGQLALLFLSSFTAGLNTASGKALDVDQAGELAAATEMVDQQENALKDLQRVFSASNRGMDRTSDSIEDQEAAINRQLNDIKLQSKKSKEQPFLILKGLEKLDPSSSSFVKQSRAAVVYQNVVTTLMLRYAAKSEKASNSRKAFKMLNDAALATKYVSKNMFSGKFLTPAQIEGYFEEMVGE